LKGIILILFLVFLNTDLRASTTTREHAEWIEVEIPNTWPKIRIRYILGGCDERHWKIGDRAITDRKGCIVRPWDFESNQVSWSVVSVAALNRWGKK
jgi:hypothetical protein